MPVQDWIPDPIASEHHERHIDAPPERALELLLTLPNGGGGVVSLLTRMRGMKSGATLEDFFLANGFLELSREPREFVFGIGARASLSHGASGLLRDAADWHGWDQPNSVRAAGDFRAVPDGDGCILSTTTLVDATDDRARRRFGLYWRAIYPFSSLIRRRWLSRVAKAAAAE